ncbi:nucleoside triphosphate pyrophosphohydrolase [Rheinheimera baltica]|uniref:nucleoside triphosphate pyrophosphohydrolase n=1 Tax=Rheinheimera baltica TaxID=67576 RepID=UPI00273D7243|nr:nucleoside triphosphate pyrophosphohydrolase [Rheinheimera baltica]MDP5143986.1 nucleoside triphosphate pyrophosphohydrolase [Rheinheimera baltica]MDP5188935.1 nucleoside triphosphate pyrophosphohydrolase [Rheinheimera baltica]
MPDNITRLLGIMSRLRDPQTGCPWDLKQSYASIVPYTLEEAYEVADAIARENFDELKDELGDLLFQVVFYAQIAKEEGRFEFDDCAAAICDKLERRHPHIFSDVTAEDADTVLRNWEALKSAERKHSGLHSVLDNIPQAMPALSRAYKLQKRCANVGFDWPNVEGCWDKVKEEIIEVEQTQPGSPELTEELGDLMFALVNVVRKHKLDPEAVLRAANTKFEMRFRGVEQALAAQGKSPEQSNLDEMEALWQQVKRRKN